MKVIIQILLLFCLGACLKKTPIKLPPSTELKIIAEGHFSDSLIKHLFSFKLSSNFGANNSPKVNEVNLLIKTPDTIINYVRVGDGLFESEAPFKGIYGENYTLQFSYQGQVHEVKTKMPFPIQFNWFEYESLDSNASFANPIKVQLNVSSPIPQYLKFNAYYTNQSDTNWTQAKIPIYRILYIPAGDSTTIKLPIKTEDLLNLIIGDKLKLKFEVLTEEVGDYLMSLKEYALGQPKGLSVNPPFYYSNEAYGLGYGTIIDSTFHEY